MQRLEKKEVMLVRLVQDFNSELETNVAACMSVYRVVTKMSLPFSLPHVLVSGFVFLLTFLQ
jgi:hypothetical protein